MPPLDFEQLASKADLTNLRIELRGEIAGVRGEISELRGDIRSEMADLRVDLREEMADLRIDLRSDMTSMFHRIVITQMTSVIAMGGLFVSLN